MSSKLTLADLLRMKQSREKIAVVTAYDAPERAAGRRRLPAWIAS